MYFKFWVITVIIGMIFHEIKCQKNDTEKMGNDKSKERDQKGSHSESQSTTCLPPSHCPSLSFSKQNHLKLPLHYARPTINLHIPSNCPPVNCRQLCINEICPTVLLSLHPKQICAPAPPCSKKVFCPPPPPCPKADCPVLSLLLSPNFGKPYPPPSHSAPRREQTRENLIRDDSQSFKNMSEKRGKRKSERMVKVNLSKETN
uniref:Uncharacterized protein n=1 Tax=Elaeophora elaphi TaxID=1147741 RepID=A0A0R3S712_9BILA